MSASLINLGWAAAVTATAGQEVADRRRIELIEPGLPAEPIHHEGKALDDVAAAALVARCERRQCERRQQAERALGDRAYEVLRGPRATLGPPWQKDHRMALAATIMAATGVVFVTLAISYFVPVASALADGRQLGAYIASPGDTPDDVLRQAWTDGSFKGLEQHLVALTPMVHALAERHLTYPVLQYFHSGRKRLHRPRPRAPGRSPLVPAMGRRPRRPPRPGDGRAVGPGHRLVPRHTVQGAFVSGASDPSPPRRARHPPPAWCPHGGRRRVPLDSRRTAAQAVPAGEAPDRRRMAPAGLGAADAGVAGGGHVAGDMTSRAGMAR